MSTQQEPLAAPKPAAPRSTGNRSTTPDSTAFRERISQGWAERDEPLPARHVAADSAAAQRAAISALHPGRRIVIPAGRPKQRSNDCDYSFRAHSAFTHLTGWGAETEPGAVLVLEPAETGQTDQSGHTAELYFRERAGRDSDEFYANPEIGEFWIGARPALPQVAASLGLATRHIEEFTPLGAARNAQTIVLREADPEFADGLDDARRAELATPDELLDLLGLDAQLAQDLSELRLVKDAYAVAEMRKAVEATAAGFADVLADLDRAAAHPRGERIVEGVFHTRARLDGNEVGYDTIAASGAHACILHWTRNDGAVRPGDLILIDAGVEVDSLYTADITRTLPVAGTFTPAQRRVYEAVLEAADAAFAIVRPGITFRDVHDTAMAVIARKTAEWGLLGMSAEEAIAPDAQPHRRYMVHGTSHHLGLDVHDCAKARRELYLDGTVAAGMVFTIEPGLYFQPDDLTVPEELRGIGVRIEDDILVTADGAENLSAAIPRTADDVEAWVQRMRGARTGA